MTQFEELVKRLRPRWTRLEKRKKLAGAPLKVGGLDDQILAVLLYYRCYITQEFIGYLFGVDKATICRAIKRLEPLLARAVPLKKDRTLSAERVEAIIIDATEQPIQRPKRNQKAYYSGKHKEHTMSTEIQINEQEDITSVSRSYPGSVHDITIRRCSDPIPKNCIGYFDSGYQGVQHSHALSELPYKRSKNTPLTEEEKAYNQALSRFRVRVENVFARLKIFNILSHTYRNKRKGYNLKFNIIAGITNLKRSIA